MTRSQIESASDIKQILELQLPVTEQYDILTAELDRAGLKYTLHRKDYHSTSHFGHVGFVSYNLEVSTPIPEYEEKTVTVRVSHVEDSSSRWRMSFKDAVEVRVEDIHYGPCKRFWSKNLENNARKAIVHIESMINSEKERADIKREQLAKEEIAKEGLDQLDKTLSFTDRSICRDTEAEMRYNGYDGRMKLSATVDQNGSVGFDVTLSLSDMTSHQIIKLHTWLKAQGFKPEAKI